jgi:hypothetical protein
MSGSYSMADNNVDVAADDAMEEEEEIEEEGAENDLGDPIAECATGDDPASPVAGLVGAETAAAAAAAADTSFFRRHTLPSSSSSDDDAKRGGGVIANNEDAEKNSNLGPMVGHAVVNAISRAKGVGLQSSRARLLQGTIDRPDWEQSRWTDGECVFGELVSRCGLDSFENTAGGGRAGSTGGDVGSAAATAAAGDAGVGGGPDAADAAGSTTKLRKTTNLSAHLVTVPALPPARDGARRPPSGLPPAGMGGETVEEIARGVLRCLKRRGGPQVDGIYLVLPPDGGGGDGCDGGVESSGGDGEGGTTTTTTTTTTRAAAISSLLIAAFRKLERYNDMIGAPKLMSDARFEFVPVSI